MDIYFVTYGPFLWISFCVLLVGVLLRTIFFLLAIINSKRLFAFQSRYVFRSVMRFLLPYHRAFVRRPIYATTRYAFHLLLFIVPIWLSGHIVLWEESRFSLDWMALPDSLADWLTIAIIAFGIYFIIRRLFAPSVRKQSDIRQYVLIILTMLPFVSGYIYSHGGMESVPFISNNIGIIHALSGELMLIMIAFLFVKPEFDNDKCIACGACSVVCPTQTLSSKDKSGIRYFLYSHFQCITCGTCVRYCPEEAVFLRHDLSLIKLFQVKTKGNIFTDQLVQCYACGLHFAPVRQLRKLHDLNIDDRVLLLCPRCRVVRANVTAPPVVKQSSTGLEIDANAGVTRPDT